MYSSAFLPRQCLNNTEQLRCGILDRIYYGVDETIEHSTVVVKDHSKWTTRILGI